jgi:WD40-like Beta Propeller Repeat
LTGKPSSSAPAGRSASIDDGPNFAESFTVKRRAAVSIAELLADGIPVHPTEAVALVRRLCTTAEDRPPRVSHPTDIVLLADGELLTGTARERGAPAAAVLAALLQALIGRAPLGHRASTALKEVAARALGVAGTEGFESVLAFADALQRFEGADPREDLRALFARWRAICDLGKDLPEAAQTVQLVMLDATGSTRRSVVVRKPDRRRYERVVFGAATPRAALIGAPVPPASTTLRALSFVESRRVRELALASAVLLTVVPAGWWFAGALPSRESATVALDLPPVKPAPPMFSTPVPPDISFAVKPELVSTVEPAMERAVRLAPEPRPAKPLPRRTLAPIPSPFWFPGGKRIGYSRGSVLEIVDVKNGRKRAFSTPRRSRIGSVVVSPDGRRLVFNAGGEGAWLLDLSKDDRKQMRRLLADPSARLFVWSPDGKRLAYYSRRHRDWRIIQQ